MPPDEGGEGHSVPSHELYESQRIQFQAPPPAAVESGVQCDSNGNIYLAYYGSEQLMYDSARRGDRAPVSRLTLDSKAVVQFPIGPLHDYAEYHRLKFYVDPRGQLYALIQAYRHGRDYKGPQWPDSLIVRYKDDGTVDSVVKLEPPQEHFEAWAFAAFLDGNFLVTGGVLADNHIPKQPLTGIFDRGGAFVRPLTLPHDVHPPPSNPPSSAGSEGPAGAAGATKGEQRAGQGKPGRLWEDNLHQGLFVGSLDGNVYLMRSSTPARLYIISSGGEVQRELVVKAPDPRMRPVQMSLAGPNTLFMDLGYMGTPEDPYPRSALGLFDLDTAKFTEILTVPPSAGGWVPACATLQREFLFLHTSKDNQLEVIKYAAR